MIFLTLNSVLRETGQILPRYILLVRMPPKKRPMPSLSKPVLPQPTVQVYGCGVNELHGCRRVLIVRHDDSMYCRNLMRAVQEKMKNYKFTAVSSSSWDVLKLWISEHEDLLAKLNRSRLRAIVSIDGLNELELASDSDSYEMVQYIRNTRIADMCIIVYADNRMKKVLQKRFKQSQCVAATSEHALLNAIVRHQSSACVQQ